MLRRDLISAAIAMPVAALLGKMPADAALPGKVPAEVGMSMTRPRQTGILGKTYFLAGKDCPRHKQFMNVHGGKRIYLNGKEVSKVSAFELDVDAGWVGVIWQRYIVGPESSGKLPALFCDALDGTIKRVWLHGKVEIR